MALIDTTNSVDTTIYLKSKFPPNKVGTNYYIENLQHKRNQDWPFRPNLVYIEEELEKQCDYTQEPPVYSSIDVAIRSVKSEKGQDIGADWADIAFRDLNHYCELGSRYRFDTSFPDMSIMTEEQKYFNTSIWLCINKNPINAGNNCVIRRCNSSIVFGGSPEGTEENITEIHTEPVVLENDLKYINMYYNMVTILPQSEWYATMQMNYFTNCIEINDRVIFNGVDLENKSNNSVFKVKAVVKSVSLKTFAKTDSTEIDNIPLVIIALDRDTISENDNFHTRLANQPPIYRTEIKPPVFEYYFEISSIDDEEENIYNYFSTFKTNFGRPHRPNITYGKYEDRILQGQTNYYTVRLMYNKEEIPVTVQVDCFDFEYNLCCYDKESPFRETVDDYCEIYTLEDSNIDPELGYTFGIKNKKRYPNGPLIITCSCENPLNPEQRITQSYEFTLGGFY